MPNTYVTETLSGATFYDATTKATTTLSGTWLAEYDSAGNLVSLYNPSFTITSAAGAATSWTAGAGATLAPSQYQIHPTGSSNVAAYTKLYVDYAGETPTTLVGGTTAATSTSVSNTVTGNTDYLQSTGTVTSAADTAVTTTINGAAFADGSTLSGTWTAIYDASGTLQAVENTTFTVTNAAGASTTFTGGYTLPYANNVGDSSYEITFGTQSNTAGPFTSLYVDWKSEKPSSFYEGSPSLYTSVKTVSSAGVSAPIRLAADGTTGVGSVPTITGLPAGESGYDNAAISPFSAATITDSDTTTSTSATITLNVNSVASDADGALSGSGLTKIAAGTYSLAAMSPANLTTELRALRFTPTSGQVAAGNTVSTRIDLAVNDSDGSAAASTSLVVTATCFLRGTMIATPHGETAVEMLTAGDLVTVIEHGIPRARPVRWVGGGRMDAADFGNRADVFPVRIRKDAFADGCPTRDLFVTPEHCILTEAGLTPVRMLVNRRSIVIDRSKPSYDFHHVELETHGILMSEGLTTESYLDSGNRNLFIDQADGTPIYRGLGIAAPLAVAREIVEPLWNRLDLRARDLGLEDSETAAVVTDQSEMRLLLDTGVELAARWHEKQLHMFQIPKDARPLRLLSRSSEPSRAIGPFVDDRRRLGVAVDRLVLWNGLSDTVIPFRELALDGWHEAEDAFRWTDGNAALELPPAGPETFLAIHLAGTAVYLISPADQPG